MHHSARRLPRRTRFLSTVVAVAVLAGTAAMGMASAGAAGAPVSTLASDNPINTTPRVMNGAVYGIERTGTRVFAGGTFTTVRNSTANTDIARSRLMSYNHTTGTVDAWAPTVNGTVEAIALSTDGQWLFAAGSFTQVNGVASKGLAKISTTTGLRDPNFTTTVAGGTVADLELRGDTLYLTGTFTTVRTTARAGLAAVSATNGSVLPMNLPITTAFSGTTTAPRKIDVDAAGTKMVVIGNFRSVGGATRPQIAVVNLSAGGNGAVSTSWNTSAFSTMCASVFDTYMRDVEISPDGTFFVINTTGAWGGTGSMCDSTSRWDLTASGADVRPTWVNYTGGDTLYGIGITNQAVYVGGHQRWLNNSTPPGGDQAGPGAVAREGIAALDPLTGLPLSWNPGKERGVGTFAITPTTDALYIGHDTQYVNGEYRPRLSAFPMTTATNPAPQLVKLPVNLLQGRNDGSVRRADLDGVAATNASTAAVSGLDASQLRGAFVQNGQLYSWDSTGSVTRRSFDGTTVGSATDLIASAKYVVAPPANFTNVRAAAYDKGRLYYLRAGDNRLFWRWFSLESGIAGSSEFVASGANWSGVTGIEIAGNWIYYTRDDAKLYRAYAAGGSVLASSQTLVDDTTDWSQGNDLFFTQAAGAVADPAAPGAGITCGAGEWTARYYANTTFAGLPENTRCESDVANNWGYGSPAGTFVGPDQFSVRWSRTIDAPATAQYTFSARGDDGIRIIVDGQVILNEWRDQAPTNFTATATLAAGPHDVVVEYYENGGGAEATVSWTAGPPITRVGLVVPTPTTLGSDQMLVNRLTSTGAQVVVLDDNTVDAAAVASLDAVVISGRISPAAIGTRLNSSTTPVVVAKAWFMDELGMTLGGSSQGTVSTTTATVTAPSSPLAGGLTEDQSIFSVATAAGYGTPSSSGSTVATVGGKAGVWGYAPGAQMTGTNVAAGCRVALPFEGDVANAIAPAGWTLFDAAVSHALSSACDA